MAAALTVWLTGLPGAGKSTAAQGLYRKLDELGISSQLLDGDILREGLNRDLGFSKEDRSESTRRAGEIALLLTANGIVPIVSLVSPYVSDRLHVRERHGARDLRYFEVWISTPIEICEARDPKGLYARARSGDLQHMTGVDDAYEAPINPELVLNSHLQSVEESIDQLAARILALLEH